MKPARVVMIATANFPKGLRKEGEEFYPSPVLARIFEEKGYAVKPGTPMPEKVHAVVSDLMPRAVKIVKPEERKAVKPKAKVKPKRKAVKK